jgi:hypothetical protein
MGERARWGLMEGDDRDFLAKFDQSAEGLRKGVALATLSHPVGLAITLLGHMAAAEGMKRAQI